MSDDPGGAVSRFGSERLGQRHVGTADGSRAGDRPPWRSQLAVQGRAAAVEHLTQRRRVARRRRLGCTFRSSGVTAEVSCVCICWRNHATDTSTAPVIRPTPQSPRQSGVGAGWTRPEHLEDVALVEEHQRRGGLLSAGLGPDRPGRRVQGPRSSRTAGPAPSSARASKRCDVAGSLGRHDVGDVGELVGALARHPAGAGTTSGGPGRHQLPRRAPQQAGPPVDGVSARRIRTRGRRPRRTTAARPGTGAAGGRARRRNEPASMSRFYPLGRGRFRTRHRPEAARRGPRWPVLVSSEARGNRREAT